MVHVSLLPSAALTTYWCGDDQSAGTPKSGEPLAGVILAAVEACTMTAILLTEHFARSLSVKVELADGTVTWMETVFDLVSIVDLFLKVTNCTIGSPLGVVVEPTNLYSTR